MLFMRISTFFLAVFVSLTLSSCVVKPTFKSDYDQDCQMLKREVQLSVEQVGHFQSLHCSNEECMSQFLIQVVGATIIFSTTAVISGSIAVVGNTLYWVDEQGKCSD
jgi:hypothetical protein